MGERDVFPHVGRRTQLQIPGAQHPVYPLITGTFGGRSSSLLLLQKVYTDKCRRRLPPLSHG